MYDDQKPSYVVDLNWVQGLSACDEHLSNKCNYLISPRLLFELCDRNPKRRAGDIGKFLRVWDRNRSTFFLTKLATEYVDDELRTGAPTSIGSLIDMTTTRSVVKLLDLGRDVAVPAVISRSDHIQAEYAHIKEAFFLSLFGVAKTESSPLTQHLKATNLTQEDSGSFAQSDMAWDNYWELERFVGSETEHDPAHEVISEIKNSNASFAFESLIRLLAYLRAEITAQRIAKLENDFDDIQYAVCASVSGFLASEDTRLARMVNYCLPDVRCFSTRYPEKLAS